LYVYCKAGALLLTFFDLRPLRTSWLIVGTFASKNKSFVLLVYYSITEAIERTMMASVHIRIVYSVCNRAGSMACLASVQRPGILPCRV
jgi:hypothetical protein